MIELDMIICFNCLEEAEGRVEAEEVVMDSNWKHVVRRDNVIFYIVDQSDCTCC